MLRANSRGCDDITGPLQWRWFITDVGLMTLRCQRSRAGSAAAACEAYRVVGYLRGPQPRGRRCHSSGVVD
ncbi:hypothetical protein NDU88_002565 [Pleurodeles waltl]|uniref:Uncharacterized protein n=1 Tax=Pleurodeles waltl TaxID=8319 RepID=A0AAV7WLU1_PLEWA|nr:hypothetical protein NDU88_002565 [Pleurodeles waltl]